MRIVRGFRRKTIEINQQKFTLDDERSLVFGAVQDRFGTASIVARVQLGRFRDGQRLVLRLDKTGLLLEIDQLVRVQPVDRQVQRRISHGITAESGRLSGGDFVVFRSVLDDSPFYLERILKKKRKKVSVREIRIDVVNLTNTFDDKSSVGIGRAELVGCVTRIDAGVGEGHIPFRRIQKAMLPLRLL